MKALSRPLAGFGKRVSLVILVALAAGIATAAGVDGRAPTVTIVSPVEGEIVSGERVLVTIDYFSNSGALVEFVELWIDERRQSRDKLATPRLRGRVKYEWESNRFVAGMHSLEARAMDRLGYEGTALVSISTARAGERLEGISPYIRLASPQDGERISGRTRIEVDIHPQTARFVCVYRKGVEPTEQDRLLCATTEAPYVFTIDADDLSEGTHQIYAVAKTEGGEIQSQVVSLEVVSRGGGSYVGPELPDPDTTPVRPGVEPELAIPELPLPSADDVAMTGGGLVSEGIVLARAGASRITSIPGAPPPALSVAPMARPPVEGPIPAPRVTVQTPPTQPAPVGAGGTHISIPTHRPAAPAPVAAGPKPVAPRAVDPGTAKTTAPPAPRRLAAAPPVTADVARPVAAVAALAVVKATVPAPPVVVPSPEAPRAATGGPSYVRQPTRVAKAMRTMPAPPAERTVAPPSEMAPVMSAAASITPPAASGHVSEPLATPVARVANAAKLAGFHRALVRIHVVRPGESLSAVARRYGVSARRIRAANNLDEQDDKLKAGSRLAVPPQTTVLFDDVPIAFDVAPEIINGISVAPIRHMLETAGGTVYWIGKEQLVRARIDGKTVEIHVGSREARVDEERVLLDIAAFMKQDRVLVPVRFVGSVLDVTVSYNPATEDVHIVSHTSLDDSTAPAA